MLLLSIDPIIICYESILKRTHEGPELPEFSEIYLRVAFKEVMGKSYAIPPDILKLYRKLLVLHYCQRHPSISSVLFIMERCFNRNEITNIVAEEHRIQTLWQKFITSEITNDLHEPYGEKRKRFEILPVVQSNKRSRI